MDNPLDPVSFFWHRYPHVLDQIFSYVASEAPAESDKPFGCTINFTPEPFSRFQVSKSWNSYLKDRTVRDLEPMKGLQMEFQKRLRKTRRRLVAPLNDQESGDEAEGGIRLLPPNSGRCHFCEQIKNALRTRALREGLAHRLLQSGCVGGIEHDPESRLLVANGLLQWHAERIGQEWSLCGLEECRKRKEGIRTRRRQQQLGGGLQKMLQA